MADFWEEYRKSGVKAAASDPFWDAYRSGQDISPEAQPQGTAPISIPGAVPDDPNSIGSTLGRATDLLQASYGGGVEALGEFTGSTYLQTLGDTIRKENIEEAKQYGIPEKSTWSELRGIEDFPEYIKQLGFSAAPALGVVGAGSIAGARIGSPAGAVGATIGGALGGILAGLGINVGEVQNRIKEENPDLQAPGVALGAGAAMSALDAIGAGVILRPLIKRFGAEYVFEGMVKQGITKEAAVQAIKGAVSEAATEVGQAGISEKVVSSTIGRSFDNERFISDAIDGAIGGGLVGGVAGGLSGGVSAVQQNQLVSDDNLGVDTLRPEGDGARVGDLKAMAYGIANRPTAILEPLTEVSPAASDFLDSFRRDTSKVTKASKANIGERQEIMTGGWRTELEEPLRTLTVQDIEDVASGVTSNEKASKIRTVLDEVREKAIKADIDVGVIENYLPTNLDPDFIINNKDQFVTEITPHINIKTKEGSKKASKAYVNRLVDNWLNEANNPERDVVPINIDKRFLDPVTLEAAKTQRVREDPKTARSKVAQGKIYPEFGQLEKSRTFASVPQNILQKYTQERDNPKAVSQAIFDYLEGASHRIIFAEEFGPRGEKANFKIAKIVHEAHKKGRSVGLNEVQRMYDLLDAYNNMYSQIQSKNLRAAQSVVGATVTTTVLPLVLLSSLAESVIPAIRGEVGVALTQIAPTLRTIAGEAIRSSFKHTPKTDISLLISKANLSLAAADNVMAARIGQNMFGQGASKFLRGFFKAVGLTHWTHFMRLYSAHVARAIIDRNISELASGVPVDSPRGRYLRTQLAELGIEVGDTNRAKQLNSPSTESERQAAESARVLGIRRFVEETILEPGFEDKPMWQSNGHLQLVAHLKGYPTMFTNTVIPQLARRFDPRRVGGYQASQGFVGTLGILSFMILIGYMQDYMKQVIKNGDLNYDEERTEEQVLIDVLQLTAMPIHASYILQFMSAPRYGTSGLLSIFGPTAGKVESGAKTIYSYLEEPEEGKIWRFLYKEGTPFGFYRPGREEAKELELFD